MRSLFLVVGLLAACTKASQSPTESDAAVQIADAAIDAAPREITLTVPAHPTDPVPYNFVVAFQDGDGPWTRAPAPVGDDYTLPIETDRYGVLVACSGLWQRGFGASIVQIEYFTKAETTQVEVLLSACGDPRMLGSVGGTVTNANINNPIAIAVDDYLDRRSSAGAYSLTAPLGTRDLVAHEDGAYQINRVLIHRDLQVTGSQQLDIDFAPAVATQQHDVLGLALADGEHVDVFNYFTTANGTRVRMSYSSGIGKFFTTPAAIRRAGDFDWLDTSVSRYTSSLSMAFRRYQVWGTATSNITTSWRPPIAGLDCGTDADKRAYFAWQATTADRYYVAVYLGTVFRYAGLSRGYLGAATSWAEPDLSTIDGWPTATYQLPTSPNQYTSCGLEVFDTAAGPSEFATSRHADGVAIRSAKAIRNFMP